MRRPRFLESVGVGLVAAAVVVAPVLGSAPVSTAGAATVTQSNDFEDGVLAPWVQNGDPTGLTVVADPDDPAAKVLSITGRDEGHDGVSLDLLSLYEAGDTVDISARVRVAATGAATTVNFAVERVTDGTPPTTTYDWIGTVAAVDDSAFVSVGGSYLIPEGATAAKLYLQTTAAPHSDLLVDDVVVTGETSGDPGTITLLSSDFEDSDVSPWFGRGDASVAQTTAEARTGSGSLSVTGRTANWHGAATAVTALFAEGVTYTISGWVKLPAAASGTTDMKFTVAETPEEYVEVTTAATVGAGDWVELSGTYTRAAGVTGAELYVEAADGTASFLLDDVLVTGPEGGTPPPPPPPPAGDVVVSLDFDEQDRGDWSQSGSPGLAYVADGDGGYALSITRDADYEGIQSPTGIFEAGVEYTLSMRARLPESTPGSVNARFVVKPSYTWVPDGGVAVTADGWTTITGTFTIPDGVTPADTQVYLGLGPGDATEHTVVVDDVLITRPAASVDLAWDFEDATLQGWTARDPGDGAPTVGVTTAEAHGGTYAALVSGRTAAGDGIGIDLTDELVPGETYDVTAWVKIANGQERGDITLSMERSAGGSTSYGTVQRLTNVSATAWTQVSAPYTVPATPASDKLYLYFETWYNLVNTSDLLVDDVRVTTRSLDWDETLDPIASTVDFPVGVAIDSRETTGPAAELLLHHFDQITAENHMKPEAWYDESRAFRTHDEATTLMGFAADNGLGLYGHTLVWHSQTPAWFFQDGSGAPLTTSDADKQVLRDRMRDHVFDVAEALSTGGGYGLFGSATNPVVAFDVVNEVVSDDAAAPGGLRQSEWYRILGPEYIELAFEYADEAFNDVYADPAADRPVALFINDYNTEQTGKAGRMYALVDALLDAGVPVDGVGHQFHVNLSMPVPALRTALETFADLGVVQAVTELDVTTGTPVSTAKLIDQGYYYRDAFRVFRAFEAANPGDMYSVTVWGLTDGRSWRESSGAPLVFDDSLQAKPAYDGIVDAGDLPPAIRTAFVFAGDVALAPGATGSPEWARLPLHRVEEAAQFQLRWAPDHLTAYVTVDDATVDAGDRIELQVGETTYALDRAGAGDVDAVATASAGGYAVVAHLPLTGAEEGDLVELDVRVVDAGTATTAGWNTPGVLGTLTLVEGLSFAQVPQAATVPDVDGAVDAVWATAPSVATGRQVVGSDGATAEVRTLWKDDLLYVLMEVTDDEIDLSGSDPWIQDSVEVYVDAGNYKNGSYRYDDTQIRVNADNVVSFGTGDETFQRNRVTSATARSATGYVVELSVDLLEYGGLGTFHGVDFQVNDASGGDRVSIRNWADPTNAGYQSTARWGVAELTGLPPTPPTLTLGLGEVKAGSTVPVTLEGFEPGERVEIYLSGIAPAGLGASIAAAPGDVHLGSAVMNGSGAASGTVTIPSGTAAGAYWVNVERSGVAVASASLRVLSADPAAPGGAGGRLPRTGAEPLALALTALLLVGAGAALVASRRPARRRLAL